MPRDAVRFREVDLSVPRRTVTKKGRGLQEFQVRPGPVDAVWTPGVCYAVRTELACERSNSRLVLPGPAKPTAGRQHKSGTRQRQSQR